MLMCYNVSADVRFSGTYDGLFKKRKYFSEVGCVYYWVLTDSPENAIARLKEKAQKKCDVIMKYGHFSFSWSDDFDGDFYVDISNVRNIEYEIGHCDINIENPKDWKIDKVLERCTVDQAIEIFGESVVAFYSLLTKR